MQTKIDPILTCPKCGETIKLTESLAAPLVAATRAQYEQRLEEQANKFEGERESLSKQHEENERRAAELERSARAQDQTVAQAIADGIENQLTAERKNIVEQESKLAAVVASLVGSHHT